MGLDVYVGSFTRYYLRDWKTVIQQAAEAQGQLAHIVYRGQRSKDAITDPVQVHEHVLNWKAAVTRAINGQVRQPLDWDERGDAPYFTDKPGWWGYGGLVMLAASASASKELPARLPKDWQEHPLRRQALEKGDFVHTLGALMWLPTEIPGVFEIPNPAGAQTWFGSSVRLLDELTQLNGRTLRGSPDDLARWIKGEGPAKPDDWSLVECARFGLAVFTELARASVENRLPMLLDY